MSTEIELVLERLLVLLRAQPPHLATARQQIETLLTKTPCAAETETAKKVTVRLLERLVTPILVREPEMRVIAEGLKKRLAESGTLAGGRLSFDKAAAWMTAPTATVQTKERLPTTLAKRLLMVLKLYASSDPTISTKAAQLLDHPSVDTPWLEIETLLSSLTKPRHHAASASWAMEQNVLCDALQDGIGALELKPESDIKNFDEIGLFFRQRGKVLRQQARTLAARITDNKEMAERLSKRLRHLETDLSQARIEGFMDPVTGLPDRFAFTAQLKRHLERAVLLNETFSLVLLHFYDFASTIEQLGREKEIRLVNGMIHEIRRHLRDEEYLARLSVERLVILLPKSDQNRAEIASREIEKMFAQTQFTLDGQAIFLESYCGTVALGPEMSGQEMLELTDRVAAASREAKKGDVPLLIPLRDVVC